MSLKWSACLLPCWDRPCALSPRESGAGPSLVISVNQKGQSERRAITADANQAPRGSERLSRSITENRNGERPTLVSTQGSPIQSLVCIGADAASLLTVVRPLGSEGARVTVVDVVSEWITTLKRSDLEFKVKVVGFDDEVTETTSHAVETCTNFYAEQASEKIIGCDLIASALAGEELALFLPHLLTLLRRRKALNPNKPLRFLEIERVYLPALPPQTLSETLPRAAKETWPTEAVRWLDDKVTFQQALAIETLPQNIRSYERGKIVALQSPQVVIDANDRYTPGCEPVQDLSAQRHMTQLAQSLSFLIGVAKNTTRIKVSRVEQALNEAFDAFASDFAWHDKASMASELARMLCSSKWNLQQQHTLDVSTTAAWLRPTLLAYRLAQENDWERLALQWLLHTSLVPLNHNGLIEQIFEEFTKNDNTYDDLASLIH